MKTKTCPSCSIPVPVSATVCACGYDWTMDDCPGCEKRIPEGTVVCPYCKYDIEAGTAAPTVKKPKEPKAAKEPKAVKEVEGATKEAPKVRRSGHLTITSAVSLGNACVPDTHYSELYWPVGQEVNDDNLLTWAIDFREAYREKGLNRQDMWLTRGAIRSWCLSHAVYHAEKHGKKGINDVLAANADRIAELLKQSGE